MGRTSRPSVCPPPAQVIRTHTCSLVPCASTSTRQGDLPENCFAIRSGRGGCVPQGGNIRCQTTNGFPLCCGQHLRLLLEEAVILLFQVLLRLELLFPRPLQRTGDQPVLRRNGVVLPSGALDGVGGPL